MAMMMPKTFLKKLPFSMLTPLSRVLTTSQTSPKRKEKMKGGEVIKRKETF